MDLLSVHWSSNPESDFLLSSLQGNTRDQAKISDKKPAEFLITVVEQ